MSLKSLPLALGASLFAFITSFMFHFLYSVHPYPYIDEIFHVRQATAYCKYEFHKWDPKITTLPGLYLFSLGYMIGLIHVYGPKVCTVQILRFINVNASVFTFIALYKCFSIIYQGKKKNGYVLWSAWNAATLPPLYFWSFFYYTDNLSTLFVILMYLYHLKKRHSASAFIGALSVLVRQSNIIWVGYLTLEILENFFTSLLRHLKKKNFNYYELVFGKGGAEVRTALTTGLLKASSHLLVCVGFLVFVWWNGGIVVGDRTAHMPVIHGPQVLYFTLFATFFAAPFTLSRIKPFLKFTARQYRKLIFLSVCLALMIHFNSLVHPYLLADNRHYSFYIWNRFLHKPLIRLALIPAYIFCFHFINTSISNHSVVSKFSYWLSLSLVLVPQHLLDFRYFLIPFLIFRLNINVQSRLLLLFETVFYTVINILVIKVFVEKTFYWPDFPEPQRLGW